MQDKIKRIRDELIINKHCLAIFELKNGNYIKDETAIIQKITKTHFVIISTYNIPIEAIDHVEISFYEKVGSIIVLASENVKKEINHEQSKVIYHNNFRELNSASLNYLSLHSSKRTPKGEKCQN